MLCTIFIFNKVKAILAIFQLSNCRPSLRLVLCNQLRVQLTTTRTSVFKNILFTGDVFTLWPEHLIIKIQSHLITNPDCTTNYLTTWFDTYGNWMTSKLSATLPAIHYLLRSFTIIIRWTAVFRWLWTNYMTSFKTNISF